MRTPAIGAVALLEGGEQLLRLLGKSRLAHRDSVGEGARLALQHRQVVPEVADRLTGAVGAQVAGDTRRGRPDLDVLGEGAHPESLTGVTQRHRVRPLPKGHQRLLGGPHRVPGAGQEWPLRKRLQQPALLGETLAHGLLVPASLPALLGGGARLEGAVELLERRHVGNRDQVVPPAVADQGFDQSFLVALPGRAMVRTKAVRALQPNELIAGHEAAADQPSQLRRVIVPARRRRPTPGLERLHVAVQPGSPILAGVRAHHITRRERQPGTEQLHDGLQPAIRTSASPKSICASAPASWASGTVTARSDADRCSRTHCRTVVSAPPKPCSATNRSQIRFAVCRCLRGRLRSSSSQLAMIGAIASITGLLRGRARRYVHGPGSSSARRTVLRLLWKVLANSRTVTPSWKCAHRIRSISATLVMPPPRLMLV